VVEVDVDEQLFSIAQAAAAVGRSIVTFRRLERQGVIPPGRRLHGQRRYTAAELEQLRDAAERSGFRDDPRRIQALRRVLAGPVEPADLVGAMFDGLEQPVTVTARPWHETREPDAAVTPWAALSGETGSPALSKLPTVCGRCRRPLSNRAVTDQFSRRWLLAICDLHDEQGRVRW
jgi:hypothetical protein